MLHPLNPRAAEWFALGTRVIAAIAVLSSLLGAAGLLGFRSVFLFEHGANLSGIPNASLDRFWTPPISSVLAEAAGGILLLTFAGRLSRTCFGIRPAVAEVLDHQTRGRHG